MALCTHFTVSLFAENSRYIRSYELQTFGKTKRWKAEDNTVKSEQAEEPYYGKQ